MAKGFIKTVHRGGTANHDANIYALVDDYQNWKRGDVIRTRPKDILRGYQKKKTQ